MIPNREIGTKVLLYKLLYKYNFFFISMILCLCGLMWTISILNEKYGQDIKNI